MPSIGRTLAAANEYVAKLGLRYRADVRFYVHGAGRPGRDAWPEQSEADAVFADHSPCSRMADKAQLVGEQCPDERVVVIAHSLGAVATALAYTNGEIVASHVVLLEPALYDIARGHDAIERHVTPMTEARKRANRGDLFGYWQIVGPMMFGREATRDSWHADQDLAQRFADMEASWGHGIDETAFATVPTLVVTGGWNDEYEAIAERMALVGATHIELAGAKHRPQDHPRFEPTLVDFLAD